MTVAPALGHTIRQIGPAEAKTLLAENRNNRNVRQRHVDLLALEMKTGRWVYNGQDILQASTGRILDGQHRLLAVVQSGETVPMGVKTGLDEASYATIDQGVKRSAADDLRASGVENANRVAASARLALLWMRGLPQKGGVLAKTEIGEFVRNHPALGEIVTTVGQLRVLIPSAALAAVGWMALHDERHSEAWSEFVSKLRSGADLEDGSPILVLRNTALNLRRGVNIPGDGWMALIIQAWNDHIAGRKRKVYKSMTWPNTVAGFPVVRPAQAEGSREQRPAQSVAELHVESAGLKGVPPNEPAAVPPAALKGEAPKAEAIQDTPAPKASSKARKREAPVHA